MHTQYWTWIAAGAALLIVILAGIADRRRHRRDRLDDIGWVPWRGIQVAAIFGMLAAVVLGLYLR